MTLRIVPTPLPPHGARPQRQPPRRVAPDVLAGVLPGPGRDRLADGAVLAVTTGQQPGLFTGPLYTIYKALSCLALAARLEREWRTPVVPVFWVAGDDHDFLEANHTAFIDHRGEIADLILRERPPEAPQRPLWREPCGADVEVALERLRSETPDSPFKADAFAWLSEAYRPTASLADACATALNALLGPRGLAVFRAYEAAPKGAAAPTLLAGLDQTLADGLTPVLVEGSAGRDRLRLENGRFVARRSGEQFTRDELARIAASEPERLSPNVLLRPVVEAVLLPTVAYVAGPAELGYLPDARPLYRAVADGIAPQAAVPRWSGVIVEARIARVLEKHGLGVADLTSAPGELEGRLIRAALPSEVVGGLAAARHHLEEDFARLARAVGAFDPTLERTVLGARNAGLAGAQRVERKVVASLKRSQETLVRQIAQARAALSPHGRPQERVLTLASFLIRYGRVLLDELAAEVAPGMEAS